MHNFLRNYLSQKSGCVLYTWADQPASFPEVTKRDQSSTWRSANSTRLVVEEYTSATSTDFVVRVFTPLKCYAYRRPFHWGQWGKRFFEKKVRAQKWSTTIFGPRIGGTMVEFFLEILAWTFSPNPPKFKFFAKYLKNVFIKNGPRFFHENFRICRGWGFP